MITFGFILRSLLIGYFLAGYFALLSAESKPELERPGLLIHALLPQRALFVLTWFAHVFTESYFANLPYKQRAIVYGVVSPPVTWLGSSLIGALVLYPHLVIENTIFAIVVSAIVFLLGATILAPIVGMICGLLVYIVAKPIVIFLPGPAKSSEEQNGSA